MDERTKQQLWAICYASYIGWSEHPGNKPIRPTDYWTKGAEYHADKMLKAMEERWPGSAQSPQ